MYGLNVSDLFLIDMCCRHNAHYWTLFVRGDWHAMHRAEADTNNYRAMRQ